LGGLATTNLAGSGINIIGIVGHIKVKGEGADREMDRNRQRGENIKEKRNFLLTDIGFLYIFCRMIGKVSAK